MHPETIKRIGGRDIVGNNWAEQIIKNNNDWGRITDADGKYSAVNFCENTIELRCFNSTDNWNNFYWLLITVFALADYANLHNFSFFQKKQDLEFWSSFTKYINKYKDKNFI